MNSDRDDLSATLIRFWPVLLLAGFVSAFIPLAPMLGYRWSAELIIAVFLFLVLVAGLLFRAQFASAIPSRTEFILLWLPIVLFTAWSFASLLWSSSWRAALHHSLLWSCYSIFFLLGRSAFSNESRLKASLKTLTVVIASISVACLIEYFTVYGPATAKQFNERYYSPAEITISVLPLFIALKIESDRKVARLVIAVIAVAWAAVLSTTSRAMFFAGVLGLIVFASLYIWKHSKLPNPKQWVISYAILAALTVLFFLPLGSADQLTIIQRVSGEEFSAQSARSRLLLWGLAIEGYRASPLIGIGAANYFAEYRNLRESLSSRNPSDQVLELNEDLIPERAHNEYLQILSELGVVGAALFAWLLLGIAYMFYLAIQNRASLFTFAALSGILSFLVASAASSYSFRFPANGICFFFLLAVASRELLADREEKRAQLFLFVAKAMPVLGILVSIAMIAFCIVRANSIRHITNAISTQDQETKFAEIESAITIDPTEPMFRSYYGQSFSAVGDNDSAIPQMRLAIDNGLANSTSYYNLITAQRQIGRNEDALATFEEAMRVYPRSVFLRTAFSSFLKRQGQIDRAEEEFQRAFDVNAKQAMSWQLAHDEGLERLVQKARVDENYLSPFDLKPENGPLAVANFQRQ